MINMYFTPYFFNNTNIRILNFRHSKIFYQNITFINEFEALHLVHLCAFSATAVHNVKYRKLIKS